MSGARALVIGAGPAGLAFARFWLGEVTVLEAADEIGGLCRSIELGGAIFDLGGHSFHTPIARVRDLVAELMCGRWHEQRRDARVWFDGSTIDYPFQTHFRNLADDRVVADCEAGLASAGGPMGDSLHDWIMGRFGEGIARHFLLPYNRKLWARDPRDIAADWVGERVAGAADRGAARRPLTDDSRVGYPADGGFVEIFRALSRGLDIGLDVPVVAIDPQARTVTTAEGDLHGWDVLVSTMSLDRLLAMTGAPAFGALEALAMKLVLIAARGDGANDPQRLYVADPAAWPHKIAFNHRSSPALAARGVRAIGCEVSYSASKSVPDDARLTAQTLGWLEAVGFVVPADVIATRVVDLLCAYPVPTPGHEETVRAARAWLSARGIHSIGRFGGWRYANSDACIEEGWALAEALSRAFAP